MPKFSIIIPVYNVADYLRECLNSVLAQTFTDWEAICVDDGSTDESAAILDDYAERDSRFRIIHQTNAGVSAARNTALDVVRGEWIVFLDGDDILAPVAFEKLLSASLRHVGCDLIRYRIVRYMDGDSADWESRSNEVICFDVSKTIESRFSSMGMCELAFRATLVKDVRFVELRNHEDRVYVAEAYSRACHLVDIAMPLYGYRMRDGSATHSGEFREDETRCALIAFKKILEIYERSGKVVDRRTIRGCASYWLEKVPYQISRLDKAAQRVLWREFKESLRSGLRLTGWQSFVVFVLRHTPIRISAWLLCILPHKLKLMGVHR